MASKGTECSVCFEGYNDKEKCPRMLSCGHSFCSRCLKRLLRGKTIDCPKCRNSVVVPSGVHSLSKNFALLDIVNETAPKQQAGNTGHRGSHQCEACDAKHPATFFCLDCKENACKTAAQIHKRSKTSRDHRVVSLEELNANPQLASVSVLCPEHNDQFRFFDNDCGRVICRDCYALNHRAHKCIAVAEAASKYRKEMEALVTKASSQVEKIKAAESQVMRASVSMKEACVERNDEIQEFFQQLRDAINSREQVLLDKLVSLHQSKESILTEQLKCLQSNKAFLEGAVEEAKSCIQSPGDVNFLLSRLAIVSRMSIFQTNHESYSLALEPKAQFFPEFTKGEESFFGMAGPSFSKSIEKAIRQSAGDISDRTTCAANSTATGSGIKSANLGKKATFTITSRDSQGRQRKRGGDVYEVKLNFSGVEVDVKDNDNGTYLAEYTVPDHTSFKLSDHKGRSRQYRLSVCLRGAHIKDSPFIVNVTCGSPQSGTGNKKPQVLRSSSSSSLQYKPISFPASPYSYGFSYRTTCAANSTATGSGIKSANLGKKATFTITSRDSQGRQRKRGGDVYEVKLNFSRIKVDVKDNDNGTYLAEYTVPDHTSFKLSDHKGRLRQYTLSVCLRGAHIKDSPFVVNVTCGSPQSGTGNKKPRP